MEGHRVQARVGQLVEEGLRGLDHEVSVQGARRHGPQRGDHDRPQGDRGHEMSVHDVYVDGFGIGLDQLDLLTQSR